MTRYYIFRDGQQEASTVTREEAIYLIRQYQAQETHYMLKPSFSIIAGEEEFIPYQGPAKKKRAKRNA